jgi:23S rRNA (adenine2503-C2)-methyltransferase
MSDLPRDMRERLAGSCRIRGASARDLRRSPDGTAKYLFALDDGCLVEAVAMRYRHGMSACLSTQAGCGMGCVFCASAAGGKVRDLCASEILAQLYGLEEGEGARVSTVVLMGVGEPLDNFDGVTRFLDIVSDPRGRGLSGRAVTVSTCGIVPRIYELAGQRRQLTLSVSLHAADEKKRSELMPVNRTYPLKELIPACRYYFEATGRRVTYEYAVIHGHNDSGSDADALAGLLAGSGAHVNLIPVNAARGGRFHATRVQAADFAGCLARRGINATVRRTLGDGIEAACGQLRASAGYGAGPPGPADTD